MRMVFFGSPEFAAVSLRDPNLTDRCEANLKGLREAGKLPEPAWAAMRDIVAEAKGGKWEPAQGHLARFMEGQRP